MDGLVAATDMLVLVGVLVAFDVLVVMGLLGRWVCAFGYGSSVKI